MNHCGHFKEYDNLQVPGAILFQKPIVPGTAMTFMPLASPGHIQNGNKAVYSGAIIH
jgi:hypothetical protein